jgi:hypothetical protein
LSNLRDLALEYQEKEDEKSFRKVAEQFIKETERIGYIKKGFEMSNIAKILYLQVDSSLTRELAEWFHYQKIIKGSWMNEPTEMNYQRRRNLEIHFKKKSTLN